VIRKPFRAVFFLALMALAHIPASGVAPSRPVAVIRKRGKISDVPASHVRPSIGHLSVLCAQKRRAVETKDRSSSPTIGPSISFLGFAAMLGDLCFKINQSFLPVMIGTSSLYFVSAFGAFDNLIIVIGNSLFPNARTNEKEYDISKALSYLRFVFHASGVPLLFVTVSEISKAAGVVFLQSDAIQNCIVTAGCSCCGSCFLCTLFP
jgi:hypothetical protein